jgi:histidinol phosphatase-like enzyme (inositol monophosphatase family)
MPSYERELEVAVRAVEAAGRLTLEYFRHDVAVEHKADASPVTIADRRAEELIRATLASAFPDDGILGEEFGTLATRSGRRWIVDPIDGTQSFIRGVPLYGVLVGLEDQGRCVVGAADFPALGETYWAAPGLGAFCNHARIRVSGVTSLADATLLTSDAKPEHYDEHYAGYERLLRRTARQRGWGDCYGYALVARGAAEVMVDPRLNPWDIAALVPILEEAGGVFFDWSGTTRIDGGSGIGAPSALRDEILAVLR